MISFGFENITCYLPKSRVPVAELAVEAGLDEAYIERLYANGLRSIPVAGGEPLTEQLRESVDALCTIVPNLVTEARAVVFSHSLPASVPMKTPFFDLCLPLDELRRLPAISVSGQPCAITHMAIQIVGAWLSTLDDGGILLIGGDRAYSATERIFFGSVMGDASYAAFATKDAPRHRIVATYVDTEVLAYQGEDSPPEAIQRFRTENPHRIRHTVLRTLEIAGVTLDQIAYLVPHSPYHMIWNTVAPLLRFPRERILTNYLHETGHLNANDVIVHYLRAINEGLIIPNDLVLLVSPGFGGTRGCTLVQY